MLELPCLRFEVPGNIMLQGTSNGPQHDIANDVVFYIKHAAQDGVSKQAQVIHEILKCASEAVSVFAV